MIIEFGDKETEKIWDGIRSKNFQVKFKKQPKKVENVE